MSGDTPAGPGASAGWPASPTVRARVADIHADPFAGFSGGAVLRRVEPTDTAVVIGSTQRLPGDAVPPLPVVRRRSGGGAVLVVPGAALWVDIVIDDRVALWSPDVTRAAVRVGEVLRAALADVGVPTTVHTGPPTGPWGRHLCFAALGPGELTGPDGRKVVGIAQRRRRGAACFQCLIPLRAPDPREVGNLVATVVPGPRRGEATRVLGAVAGWVPADAGELHRRIRARLGAALGTGASPDG